VRAPSFNTGYKDAMRQDPKKRKRASYGIVIGTVSSELNDGRKGELQAVDDTNAIDGKQSNHQSPSPGASFP